MAGERAAIQAEILSKISGTDECGAAEVCPSQSVRELIARDANGNLPAVGVAYRGRVPDGEQPFASKKGAYLTRWEIAVVASNAASRTSALEEVAAIVDKISTRLVNEKSAVSANGARYTLADEDIEDVDDDKVAAVLSIVLPAWMEG